MKKERDIIRDIISGMFIASTNNSACVVDTVLQVSATKEPLISVCVNKNNYTNEMIKENKRFAISILGKNTNGEIIKTFGFNSSRDLDKFQNFEYLEIEGVKILKESLGYLYCELVDVVDCITHNIFIGKVVKSERFKMEEAMTYQYYIEHKDELIKVETENNKPAWVCTVCGYVYYGENIPDDFICPRCGLSKDVFERK